MRTTLVLVLLTLCSAHSALAVPTPSSWTHTRPLSPWGG
jgi:hypothetical protein